MNAPIVLFAYNRPQHTQRTLDSLSKAEGASNSELYIFCDGPKTESDKESVERVRTICKAAKGFQQVHVTESATNKGLAQSVIEGVGEVIREKGRVIVVEDDLEFSPMFIKYMNSCLDFYDNRGVFSIAGYTPEVEIPLDYQFTTYMMHRNCSWGWATWRSKWEKIDWDVASFDSFIRNPRSRAAFNEGGNDLTPMLLRWKTGEIDSWSIRFCYAGFLAGEPTAYPRKSLVRNIGTDGTGTNMPSTNKYATPLAVGIGLSTLAPGVAPDPEIASQFRAFYGTSAIRQCINFLKRVKYYIFG